jgi:peptidoglycan/LPS O-acetylase OafA/YrhL
MSSYKQHLAAVSGFRVPCAIFVFLHHMEGHFGVPDSLFPLRQMVVSAFLLISGYLLHSIYGPRARELSAVDFYRKRLIRIYPLHILVVIFTLFLNWEREIRLLQDDLWFNGSKLLAHFSLLQCWYPSPQFVLGINGVTWTLSVILFCYLLFPWLARTGDRLWLVFAGILLLNALLLAMMVPRWSLETINPRNLVHFFPLFRMLEFILGMMLAQYGQQTLPASWLSRRWWLTLIDISVIVVALWLWDFLQVGLVSSLAWIGQPEIKHIYHQWFQLSGFAIPASLVLYWYSLSNGWVAGAMRSQWMVFLGGVSYAFYLCHRPIALTLERDWSYLAWSPTLAVVVVFFVVFVISALLFLLAELPARRWLGSSPTPGGTASWVASPELRHRQRIDNLSALLLLLVGVTIFGLYQTGWPPRTVIRFEEGIQLNLNRAMMEKNKVRFFFGWSLPEFETPFTLGYHLLDERQQILETRLDRRFLPERSGEKGVFWLQCELTEPAKVDSIALFCRRQNGLELKVEYPRSDGRTIADEKRYLIWQRHDPIKKRN